MYSGKKRANTWEWFIVKFQFIVILSLINQNIKIKVTFY